MINRRPIRALLIVVAIAAPSLVWGAGDTPKPTPGSPSPAGGRQTNEQQHSSYAELSRERLQRQSGKIEDRRDSLQNELDQLTEFQKQVQTAQDALSKAQMPSLEAEIKNVVDTHKALSVLRPETAVTNLVGTPGGNFTGAYGRLHEAITSAVVEVVRSVVPSARPFLYGQTRVLTIGEQVADERVGRLPDPRNAKYLGAFTPQLFALSNRVFQTFGTGAIVKRSELDEAVASSQGELDKLPTTAKDFFDQLRAAYQPMLEEIANAVQKAIDNRKSALGQIDQQLSEIQSEERKRAESVGKRQGTLTDNLIYTELLMILAIVAAIFYLRFVPERLALTMVQERTLGDLLGMGLLLITIIFLATGEFVDKSALVTLLGTLAGYIFARRTPSSDGRASRETPTMAPGVPENLEQVAPFVAGQVSLKCDEVKGANAYRWYTKTHGGKGRPIFRQQTSEPHVILSGFKAGGTLDATVSATNGKEGEQSAPLQVTVTKSQDERAEETVNPEK